jgi:hypothetical protein
MVSARPNRSRVDFVVLDRPHAGQDATRVQVEIRGVTALPDSHDALTPWVGRTMTAILPGVAPWLSPEEVADGQVTSGYASLVGPGEIRLSVEDTAEPPG